MDHKEFWADAHPAYRHCKSDMPSWDEYGKDVVDLFMKHWGSITSPPHRVIDWGCGGGAISHALFMAGVKEVNAVDISEASLEAAGEQMSLATGLPGGTLFKPCLIDKPNDLLSKGTFRDCYIDAIVSVAVFQHFPSKEYAREVLRVMRLLLRPGGMLLIQVRFDNGDPKYKSVDPEEPYNVSNMLTRCSWRIEDFWKELTNKSFRPTVVSIREDCNYVWYACR